MIISSSPLPPHVSNQRIASSLFKFRGSSSSPSTFVPSRTPESLYRPRPGLRTRHVSLRDCFYHWTDGLSSVSLPTRNKFKSSHITFFSFSFFRESPCPFRKFRNRSSILQGRRSQLPEDKTVRRMVIL